MGAVAGVSGGSLNGPAGRCGSTPTLASGGWMEGTGEKEEQRRSKGGETVFCLELMEGSSIIVCNLLIFTDRLTSGGG